MRRALENLAAAAALALLCVMSIGCAAPDTAARVSGMIAAAPSNEGGEATTTADLDEWAGYSQAAAPSATTNVWTGKRVYEIKEIRKVYDGDTFACRAYAGLQMERVINIRFGPASNGNRIDTPERGEPNYKEAGAALRVLLSSTMPGPGTGRVTIKNRRAGLDEVEERSGDRYIGYVEYWDGRRWASVNDAVERSQWNKLRAK